MPQVLKLTRPLSHSSISMYLECPQKYKFRYIDKLPEKPKSFFSFGRSVHAALEYFYGVAALPAPTLEQVLSFYQEHWVSEGYKDARQEDEYFADGERILREFYAKHIADFKPPFFAEYRFDIQVDGIPVTGFVDRIDKTDRGAIAIIDYKTGKSFSEDRVKTDAQLTMYQMACEELLGMKVESLTFYHLNSLTPFTTEPHSHDQIRELRGRVVAVAQSIQDGLFEPKPDERRCTWCDFKPHCPVFRDSFPLPQAGEGERMASTSSGTGRADVQARDFCPAPAALSEQIDAYGRMVEEIASLQAQADELSGVIADQLKEKGWVRAFGNSHEASLTFEEKWEFKDKPKVLDAIRKSGRWEDILAPSAPLVQKMIQDPSVPPELRQRLMQLGEKIEKLSLRCKKVEVFLV